MQSYTLKKLKTSKSVSMNVILRNGKSIEIATKDGMKDVTKTINENIILKIGNVQVKLA